MLSRRSGTTPSTQNTSISKYLRRETQVLMHLVKRIVTTQPQLIRNPEQEEQRCSFSPHCCILGGRPQAASLVQGLRPRNAPLQNHPSLTVCAHSSSVSSQQCLLPHLPSHATDHCRSQFTKNQKLTTKNRSSDRVRAFQPCGSSNVAAANRIRNQTA